MGVLNSMESTSKNPFYDESQLTLSVILPTFNEETRLAKSFEQIDAAIRAGMISPNSTEFILVDDGSTDRTASTAKELLAPLAHSQLVILDKNTGKGAAVRAGVKVANSPIVAFMDADMAVSPMQIPELVAALNTGDMAIGSRTLASSVVDCGNIARPIMGRTFSKIANATTGVLITDTQCGFKAFRTPIARTLFHFGTLNRFAFDVELLAIARRLKLTINEIPVHWSHVHGSKIRPLYDPVEMVVNLLKTRIHGNKSPSIESVVLGLRPRSSSPLRDSALEIVGPRFPVLEQSQEEVVILFPLCTSANISELVSLLDASKKFGSMQHKTISLTELSHSGLLRAYNPNLKASPVAENP